MAFTPTPTRPGVTWTKTDGANVLFPNMSAPTLIRPWDRKHQTLFAGPTVVLGGGRRYASASPRQFCLFPYPYAANVTSAEGGNLLLLREVGPAAALGPVFWASLDEGILLLSLPNSWLYGESLCKTNGGDE